MAPKELIDGVVVKALKVIPDERGRLMEIFRRDDPFFERFGQLYLSTAYPGVVKAWHYHKHQTDHFAVIRGMAKVVLYDDREGSPTRGLINEFFMGVHRPLLVRIPAGVLHGYKCIGDEEAFLINCPSEVYHYQDPDEHRIDPHDNTIPYSWSRRDG